MWYKNVGCCVGCYHMSFRSNELARYLFCPSEMNHVNTQTTDRRINKFITHGQRGLDDDRLLLSLNFSPRILKSRHQSSVHLTPFFLSSLTLIGKTLILIVYLYTTQDNFCNSTDNWLWHNSTWILRLTSAWQDCSPTGDIYSYLYESFSHFILQILEFEKGDEYSVW